MILPRALRFVPVVVGAACGGPAGSPAPLPRGWPNVEILDAPATVAALRREGNLLVASFREGAATFSDRADVVVECAP